MDILPITLWREARGEGEAGMRAVCHVILNRAAHGSGQWPSDPERACLQAYQFSCWNTNDPQRNKYPPPGDVAYSVAYAIAEDPGPDPTLGATSYHDTSIQPPPWATPDKFTVQIGRLRFYKL
jgi:N-acetylmuramoyl-L-alanine amidase